MPSLKTVEAKIREIEGFDVKFMQNGSDVRSDKRGIVQYNQGRRAPGSNTVTTWIKNRFLKQYAGYDVAVLNGSGDAVAGNTLLSNLRSTY